MSEMIERVARALSIADGMQPEAHSNDGDELPMWTLYVKDARAAIEAMREPTPEMMLSATRTEKRLDEGSVEVSYLVVACDIWPKMIDAALRAPVAGAAAGMRDK